MALDVGEGQVLINFFQDADDFVGHGRLLSKRLGTAGQWIIATPDLEIAVLELSRRRRVPSIWNAPFPRRDDAHTVCFFGHADITEYVLRGLRAEAGALCVIMGGAPSTAGPTDAIWVFTDPSLEGFSEAVPGDRLQTSGASPVRGSVGLADRGHGQGRALIEHVRVADMQQWMEAKRTGAGRDRRVGGSPRLLDGVRLAGIEDVLTFCREESAADWPFRGPRVIDELVAAIRASWHSWLGYYDFVCAQLGLGANTSTACMHGTLIPVPHLLAALDQVNLYNLAEPELLARRVLRIHKSVRRNPESPDFSGLELMVSNTLDTSAGASTGDFAKFIAEEQKAEAFTLKQLRLAAEEASWRLSAPDRGGAGAGK